MPLFRPYCHAPLWLYDAPFVATISTIPCWGVVLLHTARIIDIGIASWVYWCAVLHPLHLY